MCTGPLHKIAVPKKTMTNTDTWNRIYSLFFCRTKITLAHPSAPPPPFTQSPYPPRSLVRDGQTHPHRPRLVVYHSTCRPLSSSPPREQLCNRSCSNKTHTVLCGDLCFPTPFVRGSRSYQSATGTHRSLIFCRDPQMPAKNRGPTNYPTGTQK